MMFLPEILDCVAGIEAMQQIIVQMGKQYSMGPAQQSCRKETAKGIFSTRRYRHGSDARASVRQVFIFVKRV